MSTSFDVDDPFELVGVEVVARAEAASDMAYVFAEEFARLGYGEQRLLHLFKSPFYMGAHRAYLLLGEEAVSRIIKVCVAVWGRRGSIAGDDSTPRGA